MKKANATLQERWLQNVSQVNFTQIDIKSTSNKTGE